MHWTLTCQDPRCVGSECGEHHALLADRFNGCRGIRDTAPASTRTHRGKLSTIIDQIAYGHHGYLETLNSSGRSPFYKFVVQQIKKAGPRTDSAAKAEPTSPSRRSSRRPYPLSAPGLAGVTGPQADTFRPMPTG